MSNTANTVRSIDNLIGELNAYDEDSDGFEPGDRHRSGLETRIAVALLDLRNTVKARAYLATLGCGSKERVIARGFEIRAARAVTIGRAA